MREFGGYLPFDSRKREYFCDIEDVNICRLNAARYAIIKAVKDGGYKKIWVPVYLCVSVLDVIKKDSAINYGLYNINQRFEPILESIAEDECILLTNYYGQKNDDYYFAMTTKYKNIIFDNTQCFYIKPNILNGVYNVYSPRKFFGVTDGAYLIGRGVKGKMLYDKDESGDRAKLLFESLEHGTNACYDEYLKTEDELTYSGIREMSYATKVILGNIDYEGIRKHRLDNYLFLCEAFNEINELRINYQAVSPMVYPLLVKKNELRKTLVSHKVYVPQWWKAVIENEKSNEWERYISENIYPLPIDQRYTTADIKELICIVNNCINGKEV